MKAPASLSLDLDNQWAYMRTAGDPRWADFPSCLEVVVPRMLAVMAQLGVRLTVFVVGKDASVDHNRDILGALSTGGHDIANHSFRHEAWLHRYSYAEIDDELARSEDAIEAATGAHPLGFRGPGYSLGTTTLRALVDRGYHYDASTLPTFIGPLARAWYFHSSGLGPQERAQLVALFGRFGDARRPNQPYRWRVGADELLEIPVTTMPFARVPVHLSYVLALASISPALGRRYFDLALLLCRRTGCQPSILLHSLDFVDRTDVPDLAFFPGMSLPHEAKVAVLAECLESLKRRFKVETMAEQASRLSQLLPERVVAPGHKRIGVRA